MLRPILHLLSPAGRRARLSVLIFHRVHAQRDLLFPDEPDAARFAALLDRLKTWCNVPPVDRGGPPSAQRRTPGAQPLHHVR